MRRTRRATVAVLPVVALVLAACSSGGGDQGGAASADFTGTPSGTMNGWAFDNADDVGTARMDHAAGQLDGVTVKLDQTAFDAQKFTTRLAGGDVPDVVQMDRRYVTTYAAQGLILPLDECFTAHDVDPDTRWYPFVVDDVRYQDKVWAVPQFYQPPAILLNKRVMDAAGVTDEQIDTSKPDVLVGALTAMYKESGGVPTTLGFDPVATGQAGLWVLAMGGRLTDDAGKPTLDDPANTAGLDLLKKIADAQGGFAKVKSFTDAFDTFGDANQFVTDQVGAQVDAQWYPNVLSPYLDKVQLGAVPFKDKDGKPFTVTSGQAFVIPQGAKNPAAACAWALELTTLDAWKAAAEARSATLQKDGGLNTGLFTGSPEADKAIRDQYVVPTGNAGFDQVISTYYDVLGYGKTFGSSPAGQDIESELNNAVTATLLGDKSATEALADAQTAAQRAYDNVTAGS
ncbi:extracellular solute-binding protein [Cellulomonas sp.]|uniref:extracellular solute-binding protein n=1 Tax=Cellulomonas sp. TaxID=40001 RepID=UPI001B082DBA|nr:extracellular solute-binding protein [Cellulomonas sp.]MBO9555156.1 extracellular solute-binding protein [Cellulomonas sp.]